MGKRCQKGKSCGATCIQRIDICLLALGERVREGLSKLKERVFGGGKKEPSRKERIERLLKARETVAARYFDKFNTDRGDGKGTHFENPNKDTLRLMKKFQDFSEKTDSLLNRLEGRRLVTAYDKNGKEFKHEPKRWYEDKFGLDKFSGLSSAARRKFEEDLIESFLSKGVKSDSPQAIFMMGGPASGKSTTLDKKFGGNPKGFIVIDPDSVKAKLPEFMFGIGAGDKSIAGKTHATSSRIAREILKRAKERGFNVLWDGTGTDNRFYTANAKELRDMGYKTQLIAQHIPERLGIRRAVARASLPLSLGGGRFVPLTFIQEAYERVPRNFGPLAKLFDSASITDSVSGKEFMTYEGGEVVREDRRMAARFRRAYGGG